MFVELRAISTVSLGYKSLQNNFFYVNKPTIETFGIEQRFVTPVLMLRDLQSEKYTQVETPSLWLFNCKEKKADLRGTGALRYIEAMADHSATAKKQTGKSPQTIREALEAQAGGLWYAPKARPNRHHIWLRKAIDGVFAPFLFETPALVDQRCNSVAPLPGVEWNELAAVLTSSLFAYSVEINGSASMGAGALEAPTTKLRGYPVFDVTRLSASDRKSLVALAKDVWSAEAPIEWTAGAQPGAKLKALDAWLMQKAGRNVKLQTVYNDIREVCTARVSVARDKVKTTKKRQTDNIGNVADSIAKAITPRMQMKNFPEDFVDGAKLDIDFSFDLRSIKQIKIAPLLDRQDVQIIENSGETSYEGTHPVAVAEAIVRCILWGRTVFSVSSDRVVMEAAITRFLLWLAEIEKSVATAIKESSLGTGYEEALKREVYGRLGIHPLTGTKMLPLQIAITAQI